MVPKRLLVLFTPFGLLLIGCSGPDGNGGGEDDPPIAPSNVTATPGEGFVTLSWTDESDNETGFIIYREEAGSAASLQPQAFTELAQVSANVETYRDDTASSDAQYRYGVAAKGEGDEVSATEAQGNAPVAPLPVIGNRDPAISAFSATVESGLSVTFSWTISDPNDDTLICSLDADGDGTSDYSLDPCDSASTQGHTYDDGGTYNASLTVTDSNGGSVTQTTSVTVSGDTPPPPGDTVSGRIVDWDPANGSHLFFAPGFVTVGGTDPDTPIDFGPVVFPAPVGANGAFSVEFGGVSAGNLVPICGDEDETSVAVTVIFGAFASRNSAPAIGDLTGYTLLASNFGVLQNINTNDSQVGDAYVVWMYSENAASLSGSCINEIGEITYNLDLEAGWNPIVVTIAAPNTASFETKAIPDTFAWYYLAVDYTSFSVSFQENLTLPVQLSLTE